MHNSLEGISGMTNKALFVFLVVFLLANTQSSCKSRVTTFEGQISNGSTASTVNTIEENESMSRVNLRDMDENENKRIIDVLLDKVVGYPHNCTQNDFVFKESINGFVLVSTRDSEQPNYYSISAYYRLEGNDAGPNDAMAKIYFCGSKEDSHDMIKDHLDGYTMMEVYESYLKVGDLSLGGIYRVDFVRGNVYMFVEGKHDVEIDVLAKDLDLQILDILNKE